MVKSLVTQHFRDKKSREKMVDRKPHIDASTDLIRGKGKQRTGFRSILSVRKLKEGSFRTRPHHSPSRSPRCRENHHSRLVVFYRSLSYMLPLDLT